MEVLFPLVSQHLRTVVGNCCCQRTDVRGTELARHEGGIQ